MRTAGRFLLLGSFVYVSEIGIGPEQLSIVGSVRTRTLLGTQSAPAASSVAGAADVTTAAGAAGAAGAACQKLEGLWSPTDGRCRRCLNTADHVSPLSSDRVMSLHVHADVHAAGVASQEMVCQQYCTRLTRREYCRRVISIASKT